jgi:hypothetical protein
MREKCTQNFVGEPEGKRPFGRPRRRWDYNIKRGIGFFYGCETWSLMLRE